jgi:N-acetylglutamate synthase-like GNAT family acetyltransferase
MEEFNIIDLTPENIAEYGVCGYKDANKHEELRRKIEWVREFYPKGLRIKALISETGGYQGMIEYIPGEYAHRPVDATGYLFIHCLFVGFKKEYKGKGFASLLIETCINEAIEQKMSGVAVVTRKGSFMADSNIFLKKGFEVVDSAKPDFNLLVYKLDEKANNPSFKPHVNEKTVENSEGLIVMRSAQCPYTVKNVNAILDSADKMKITTKLIDMTDANDVQNNPCPFGSFGLIYNGKIISHHPISNTRFENIMGSIKTPE